MLTPTKFHNKKNLDENICQCAMKEVPSWSHEFWGKTFDGLSKTVTERKNREKKTRKAIAKIFVLHSNERNNTIGSLIIRKSKNENP